MSTSFADLGLQASLLDTLSTLDYRQPTEIQCQAIPPVLAGQDLIAEAQTGTGKTAAFALPLLQRLAANANGEKVRPVRGLVMAPTRELALQVKDSCKAYGTEQGLRIVAIFGGVRIDNQIRQMERGADLLVATPGRLLDLIDRRVFDLTQLETLVLDEADRMLDLGFSREIERLVSLLPAERQTLLFSATFASNVEQLARQLTRQPQWLRASKRNSAANTVQQLAYGVDNRDKADVLSYMIDGGNWRQLMVFTRTKKRADLVTEHLQAEGISAAAIHGDKHQRERLQALEQFKAGQIRVLVATDVAARGLDIDALPRVVNYDLPQQPEAYVHRIGRTGRAGSSGQAISLVAPDERRYLQAIETLIDRPLKVKPVPYFENGVAQPMAADRQPTGRDRNKTQTKSQTKPKSKPGKNSPKKSQQPPAKQQQPKNNAPASQRPGLRPSLMSATKPRKKS
ncbi:DEAD/DEAH box helicase [Marinobacterium arenosum]|uniref:DEAD/DEAH box helicase n=1 Tax=Marinobacterium arenosum TaxID=2862496 RepID=UPI001C96B085|nr:DEAD/DEAH box helicase [Marinobacterium arenosum]MBY4677747.1 DEAD/DEAH box helicase [Marinobacterium arenosum]